MFLDLVDAAEANPHGGLFDEKLFDQILGLWLKLSLVKFDLLALLDIVISLKI